MMLFVNDTATTEIYTLSLHDALPICRRGRTLNSRGNNWTDWSDAHERDSLLLVSALATMSPDTSDRKSTRLNYSHANISYAGFCLKNNHIGADQFLHQG